MASFRSLSPRAEQVVNPKDRGQMPSFLHNAIQDILNRSPHLRERPVMSTVGDLSDLAPTTLGAIRPELLQRKYLQMLPAYQRRIAIIPETFLPYWTSPRQSRTKPPLARPKARQDNHQPTATTQNTTARGLPEIERDVQNRTRQLREAMHLVVDLEAKLLELELEQHARTAPTKKKRKSRAEKRADWENKGNGKSNGLVIICGIAGALAIVALAATATTALVSETDVSMHKICSARPPLLEVLALDVGAPPFNHPDSDDADASLTNRPDDMPGI
ncbi:GTPase-activator protein for Rho-like GTPase [Colletotrichum sp. SAR 10_70]|nr:GTPase-activator protein for Rho-like GTPase [Colletotrichum sp. SAR 10_71]KAI8173777.1 GTPase-activator protein for Rho-like GTPase [Colletotrichum sp. SAR 10_70]KAJ4995583.1 GTPase-activator protein for Rho-like GTPase [Colletotrichum sp. SAR 10_66]